MHGKIFWGLVILLFIGIVIIPFILPSDDAGEAEAHYYESEAGSGGSSSHVRYRKKSSRKKYSTKRSSRSVRSAGGSRSYRSGK